MSNGSDPYRGLCSACARTVEVLTSGCLAEHLDDLGSRCAGSGVPLLAQQEGEPTPSVETVLRDEEHDVVLVVERMQDPMRLRFIVGSLTTGNANSSAVHREQVVAMVDHLDRVTQAARAVMVRAVIDLVNGAEPEVPAVDWAREIPCGAGEFGDRPGEWVALDLVDRPVVRFALFVHDLGVAGPRQIGLVMSIDQARGLRDDLRRSLAWMDAIAGFDPMGDAA